MFCSITYHRWGIIYKGKPFILYFVILSNFHVGKIFSRISNKNWNELISNHRHTWHTVCVAANALTKQIKGVFVLLRYGWFKPLSLNLYLGNGLLRTSFVFMWAKRWWKFRENGTHNTLWWRSNLYLNFPVTPTRFLNGNFFVKQTSRVFNWGTPLPWTSFHLGWKFYKMPTYI